LLWDPPVTNHGTHSVNVDDKRPPNYCVRMDVITIQWEVLKYVIKKAVNERVRIEMRVEASWGELRRVERRDDNEKLWDDHELTISSLTTSMRSI
jgi:hypothetical protein